MPTEDSGKSLLAEDAVVGPLVSMFVGHLPQRIEALHNAERRSDWRKVASLAHQMAGAAGGYGFPGLRKVAVRIEAQANDGASPRDLAQSIAAFAKLCNRVIGHHGPHVGS